MHKVRGKSEYCLKSSPFCFRKNRNMYAQVLLAMLKRDLIEEPFSQHPESGPLPTMPAYMVSLEND